MSFSPNPNKKPLPLDQDLLFSKTDMAANTCLPDANPGDLASYFNFLEEIGALDRKKQPRQFVDAVFSLK